MSQLKVFIFMWKYDSSNFNLSTFSLLFHFIPFGLFRQAWALVSVVKGGNTSCSEDLREHENLNTGGRALARCNFTTVDGVDFSVTAYSEWKNGKNQIMTRMRVQKQELFSMKV